MTLAAGTTPYSPPPKARSTSVSSRPTRPSPSKFIELAQGAKEWTHPARAPKSSQQALRRTIFHPSSPNFMIQGGDPAGTGRRTRLSFPGRDQGSAPTSSTSRQAGHGQSRPQHQRLPVLHHRRAHAWLTGNHTHLRRSRRGQEIVTKSRVPAAARTKPHKPVCGVVRIERAG